MPLKMNALKKDEEKVGLYSEFEVICNVML